MFSIIDSNYDTFSILYSLEKIIEHQDSINSLFQRSISGGYFLLDSIDLECIKEDEERIKEENENLIEIIDQWFFPSIFDYSEMHNDLKEIQEHKDNLFRMSQAWHECEDPCSDPALQAEAAEELSNLFWKFYEKYRGI